MRDRRDQGRHAGQREEHHGLLTLVAALGTEVTLVASGLDAQQAVDALAALVNDGFGEGVADA